jgi:hypothetical protein
LHPEPREREGPLLDKGIASAHEGDTVQSDVTWYLTVDVPITEFIRDLIIGVGDVMVTAGGEPTLRQELRYLRDRVEEMRER